MKRFLIFTLLFPPLALAVFTAPDIFARFIDWFWIAYIVGIVPAWLMMGVDWALSARPFRVPGTAAIGALIAASVARFMWGSFGGAWPVLMAGLVGGLPAAACSWLSSRIMAAEIKR